MIHEDESLLLYIWTWNRNRIGEGSWWTLLLELQLTGTAWAWDSWSDSKQILVQFVKSMNKKNQRQQPKHRKSKGFLSICKNANAVLVLLNFCWCNLSINETSPCWLELFMSVRKLFYSFPRATGEKIHKQQTIVETVGMDNTEKRVTVWCDDVHD